MDIPLEKAMLCWNEKGGALVVLHPDSKRVSDAYENSNLACFSSWAGWTTQERQLKMMVEAWHAVAFDGVDPVQMHEALTAIPEYRALLAEDVQGRISTYRPANRLGDGNL